MLAADDAAVNRLVGVVGAVVPAAKLLTIAGEELGISGDSHAQPWRTATGSSCGTAASFSCTVDTS